MNADAGDEAVETADLPPVCQILGHAPHAVVVVRPDWTLLWSNRAGRALFTPGGEPPAARPVTDLLVDDGALRRFQTACTLTGCGRALVSVRLPDGAATRAVARGWRAGPDRDAPFLLWLDADDSAACLDGRAPDPEALGRLAGSLAHEFNNVLTVILCGSAHLRDELDAADPRRGLVDDIENAGLRAADLTRQLLLCSQFA